MNSTSKLTTALRKLAASIKPTHLPYVIETIQNSADTITNLNELNQRQSNFDIIMVNANNQKLSDLEFRELVKSLAPDETNKE